MPVVDKLTTESDRPPRQLCRENRENMAKNGVELELKGVLEDSAAVGGKRVSSPNAQRPNYESLKEVNNDNNGKYSK